MNAPAHHPGRWLSVIGIGEDGPEGLSPAAKALIENAALVVGGKRHLALADDLAKGETLAWPSPIAQAVPTILARRGEPVVVLASGDPYCFGVGAMLATHIPVGETHCLPATSSVSLAAARLGWAQDDLAIVSLCGRPLATLAPHLQPGRRLLILSADDTTPAEVAAYLTEHGFGQSQLSVLEALGGAGERIRSASATDFGFDDVARLNLLGVQLEADDDAQIIPLSSGLPDELFVHDGQITKREIRAVTLSSLAPRAGELLWDVGCGSGSIAIEFLLRHPANQAIGIEQDETRAARAAGNAAELGVPRLQIMTGEAPQALSDLPAPDAIFIGGGGNALTIATCLEALKPGGRLVVNAVTLDTERTLLEAHARHGGALTRLSVERLDRIGGRDAFRPAMTVTQWAYQKRGHKR